MNKTILSVGAGYPQEEFADAIKDRGYKLISIGKGKNSERVISLSDAFAEIDTHSFEEVDKWICENQVHFDAAGSFAGGGAIITLQKINKKYGMPTQIPEDLMVGMDKFSQASLYEKYNLTSIKSWTVSELKDVPEDIEEFVVKPAVGRGSVGVEFLSRETLVEKLEQHSIPEDFIIQVFRKGVEYRMMAIVQKGELKLLAPIKRDSYGDTTFLGRLSCATEDLRRLQDYSIRMVKAMGIDNSVIKFDVLVSERYIDMIEMDISVGGGIYFQQYISKLFECDIINRYIDLILDIPIDNMSIVNNDYVMDYVYNETGKPLKLDQVCLEAWLNETLKGNYSVILNRLRAWESGRFSSNADFVCAVVHKDKGVEKSELCRMMNKELFIKW